MARSATRVAAVDLFCGVGGLSYGLQQAGITVAAGIDNDPKCRYPFESNIESPFIESDVRNVTAGQLERLWPRGRARLLAGCAPCQPFSPYRRGIDTSRDDKWPLLDEFGRLVEETQPEYVTMENVPRLGSTPVFAKFVALLEKNSYHVNWKSCYGPNYGLPQERRRLVLVASLLGDIQVPERTVPKKAERTTVRDAIGSLPPIDSGGTDPNDRLHKSRKLSPKNLARIQASRPGGTWRDWPEELLAPCHAKSTGASFQSVYARMSWDEPSPTITTLAYNFGTGRFGHPEQDRPISLREAAILQGFPADYRFVPPDSPVHFTNVGRLIGNAVPPALGAMAGDLIRKHATKQGRRAIK